MYKPEFSKRNLQASLDHAGITYVHMGHLGVPRDVRALAIESGDRDLIWEWYDANVTDDSALYSFFNVGDHPEPPRV